MHAAVQSAGHLSAPLSLDGQDSTIGWREDFRPARTGLRVSLVSMRSVFRWCLLCLIFFPFSVGHAETPPAPAKPSWLPKRARDVCEAGCLGYSPSTRSWLCGSELDAHGRVATPGKRCLLQLLRDELTLAEITVYHATSSGEERADRALPLEQAINLAPTDLTALTTMELKPWQELALPGVKHHLRLEDLRNPPVESLRRGSPARRSEVVVLCNRELDKSADKQGFTWSAQASGGKRQRAEKPPKQVVVFVAGEGCDQRESFQLQRGSDPSQIVLIEHLVWGCIDYQFSQRHAHPIDLARTCEDGDPS